MGVGRILLLGDLAIVIRVEVAPPGLEGSTGNDVFEILSHIAGEDSVKDQPFYLTGHSRSGFDREQCAFACTHQEYTAGVDAGFFLNDLHSGHYVADFVIEGAGFIDVPVDALITRGLIAHPHTSTLVAKECNVHLRKFLTIEIEVIKGPASA